MNYPMNQASQSPLSTHSADTASLAEQLSALADNQLDADQVCALVQKCAQDNSLLKTWASYHTIGDVLRANARDLGAMPAVPPIGQAQLQAMPLAPLHSAPAANDSVFRWKLIAGFAAVAAVGSVLWATVGSQGGLGGAQLAQVQGQGQIQISSAPTAVASVVSTASQGSASLASGQVNGQATGEVMIRDPRLDELMAAHKQFGGASALQQPAGFLRNATFQPTRR